MYVVTQEDLSLILSTSVSKQAPKIKIEVLENDKLVGVINGIVGGTMNISAESDIRRTCNFTVCPTLVEKLRLTEDSLLWLNKDIRIEAGLYDARKKDYKFYKMGTYVYTDTSGTYDATTNQLSINCSDFMKKLDGTKNGQIGALQTLYPAYEENKETGEVIKYNYIRNAIITTLEQLANIKKHQVDDIGEYKANPDYNSEWEQYRIEHPLWNTIPYDQEFPCGCSILSILTAFRDLYPNYEMFFDENNTFICQMVPSCYEDNIFLDYTFIKRVLISENTTVDMTSVRNVCEVWGKVIETDYYTENCSYSNNIYSCNIESCGDYYNGDIVSIKVPSVNAASAQININNFGSVTIYDANTEVPIGKDRLNANGIYSFKISKKRINQQTILKAYLLGQWQPHALSVLTNGKEGEEVEVQGIRAKKYSMEYFKAKYNCETVELNIITNSPFTVQNLGEILDVKHDGEYENITSDDLALSRAHWENWKNCRLTDNITITTALLLFMDVNVKVSYKPSDSDVCKQYIVKSVSHDFSAFTTTITMCRFYPLYEAPLNERGTHKALSYYSHEYLSKFTHEELTTIVGKEEI